MQREGEVKLASWTWGPISQPRCLQPRGAFAVPPRLPPSSPSSTERGGGGREGNPRTPLEGTCRSPASPITYTQRQSDLSKPSFPQGLYLQAQMPSMRARAHARAHTHTPLPRASRLQWASGLHCGNLKADRQSGGRAGAGWVRSGDAATSRAQGQPCRRLDGQPQR